MWPERDHLEVPRHARFHRDAPKLMRKRSLADNGLDPMEMMGNLFDVATLIGVGFLIMAFSGLGMKEMLSGADTTIVKNPGTEQMEIIIKEGGKVQRLKQTKAQAQGKGVPVGTVYKLEDGRTVWVPDKNGAAAP
mgnify:CR=1 FL=1